VPTLRSGKVWQIWRFTMFLSISLLLSRNLTPSLYCTISYVNESRRWQTFSLFSLSELLFPFLTIGISIYQKIILPYCIIPYLFTIHPKLLPLWSVPVCLAVYFITPCSLSSFFPTERAGPYPQAQLYWAGRTMGWMADWTSLTAYQLSPVMVEKPRRTP
jgi:hypothetical protein